MVVGFLATADWRADHSGVMVSPKEQLTAQNYDLQFGTNVIGTCLSSSG